MVEALRRSIERFQSYRSEKQWSSQIQRLLAMGFHIQFEMPEQEYLNTSPAFTPYSMGGGEHFRIPLLVDPRLSLFRQLQLHGVLPESNISDAELANASLTEGNRVDIPKHPYQIWVNPGSVNRSMEDFSHYERGLTIIETLALLRERSRSYFKTLDRHNIIQARWKNP